MAGRKHIIRSAFAAAIALAAGRAEAQDVRIAVAGPMTGQYAAFGEQLRRGAEMAVADINAKGGVLGRKLVMEIGDDACDPKQAVAVNDHRLLPAEAAAFYLGMPEDRFRALVKAGELPAGLRFPGYRTMLWDVRLLDAEIDRRSGFAAEPMSPRAKALAALGRSPHG